MKTALVIAPTLVPRWNDLVGALRKDAILVISSDRSSEYTDLYVPQWFGRLVKRMRRPALYCPNPLALYCLVKREKIERIVTWADGSHISALFVMLIARRLGIPYEIRAAQNIPDAVPAPFCWYAPSVIRNAARLYSVAPPSTAVAAPFVADKGRLLEIGNGFDDTIFSLTDKEQDLPAREIDAVFAGHLEPRKGIDLVAQTLRALFDEGRINRAAIVGKGPSETQITKLLGPELAGNRLERYHWLSREELAGLFRRSRLLLMPSRSNVSDDLGTGKLLAIPWTEQFGRVCVEAQACGTVPIVSGVGGLPFAVGQGGIVVDCATTERLTRAASDLLDDPDRLAEMRQLALQNAQRFTLSNIAAAMVRAPK
ncbi:glycosyltransferase family 4 protein [Sulfitobacter sp. 1A05707]|uniref:glycosyltransferase family 4 protein n=1 Tax=Sulfitobacter sp. 1A05707 TaxID=3368560 RepID=UPI00374502C5